MGFDEISRRVIKYFCVVPAALFSAVGSCDGNQLEKETKPANSLEDRCSFDYDGWDKSEMEKLVRSSVTSRVTMFGIDHGNPDEPGDKRDGEFVAGLLPFYNNQGFCYVAVEGPASLNERLKNEGFEEEARNVFGLHWAEFGPVIQRARELGMQVVFYDTEKDYDGDYSDRDAIAFGNVKRMIFDKDHDVKVVFYSGARHMHKDPVEVSFLDRTKVKTIGCFLYEMFDKGLTTVYLQPEKTRVAFFFDHEFYLGKQCLATKQQHR